MRMKKLIKTWNLFVANKNHQQVLSPCFFPMISLQILNKSASSLFSLAFNQLPTWHKSLFFLVYCLCCCCTSAPRKPHKQNHRYVESSLSNSNAATLVERPDQPMCLWYTIHRYLCTWRYILFFKPTVKNIWNLHDVNYLDCCVRFRLDV